MNTQKLKVIIADRSNYSRLVLASMVQAQPDLEVLDTAADNLALLGAMRLQRPDVVLADLADMARNSRLHFLRQLHQEMQVPVLAVLDQHANLATTFEETTQWGVYDYVVKPAHKLQPQFRTLQVEILKKIRASRQFTSVPAFSWPNATVLPSPLASPASMPKSIVVIGASTGGTQAIEKIIASLDEKLEACILIAVHLPAAFTRTFAKRLQTLTSLNVVEGKLGTRLLKGKIIVAPGGRNMVVMPGLQPHKELMVNFLPAAADEFNRPSVDMLMRSVAQFGSRNLLGVVLTGMGKDGTEGCKAILQKGGTTVAQDQASSVVFGMARSAIANGCVSYVRHLNCIPKFINQFVAELPAFNQAF